jgi:UDP-N-acetylglucosamine acyltransferase
MTGMIGWAGIFKDGERPRGVHPLASVGGPPESRLWMVGDPMSAPVIADSALVHAFCTIDAGMIGLPTTSIGERSFLMAGVHMGHNAVVGDDCEIGVRAVISGEVIVGNGVKLASLSWVKPCLTIGDGAIIGGGSVITRDIPAHEVWCGNPARYLKLAFTHPEFDQAYSRGDLYSEMLNG